MTAEIAKVFAVASKSNQLMIVSCITRHMSLTSLVKSLRFFTGLAVQGLRTCLGWPWLLSCFALTSIWWPVPNMLEMQLCKCCIWTRPESPREAHWDQQLPNMRGGHCTSSRLQLASNEKEAGCDIAMQRNKFRYIWVWDESPEYTL